MATEPPRRVENREAERLEGLPGSAPAGAAAANGEEVEETARLLDGCVPLSHQVAGHMFGKDKGGEWREEEEERRKFDPRGCVPVGERDSGLGVSGSPSPAV